MPTDPGLLTLAQWLSPAYPVGAFAYSHGLEAAIAENRVTDAGALQAWIADVLRHGSGWNDALFLSAAYVVEDPTGIDQSARAFAGSKERLEETLALGTAFADVTRQVWDIAIPPLCYPVAVGYAAGRKRLPQQDCTALYLQAFVANLTSVGQWLIPIGQTEAQRIVQVLAGDCARIAERSAGATLNDLSATAFLADIAAMRHETLEPRVFRT